MRKQIQDNALILFGEQNHDATREVQDLLKQMNIGFATIELD